MKKFQHIMQGLIVIAIIFATYMVGVYSTKYKQNKEDNKSTTTMIAVVNTDQGITVAGENVNYASDLIIFPDVNFTVTGLTDALQEIAENRYAAYILIPSTFSKSVISVNREPQKVQVTYEINPNLREDAKMKVVGDIHNFLLALNTNISYIYVDSILHEVHAVQDGSAAVMENDTADMQAIIAVEQAELIEDVEYEPLKFPETEIEYMDLSDDNEYMVWQKQWGKRQEIVLMNMTTEEKKIIHVAKSTDKVDVQFSPNNKYIFMKDWHRDSYSGIRYWYLYNMKIGRKFSLDVDYPKAGIVGW